MSAAELAESVGVSPQAVSQWLNNQTMPSHSRLLKIASAFDITIGEIMDGDWPDTNNCQWCGAHHQYKCPMVKAYEYYPDGTLKRVEFFPVET